MKKQNSKTPSKPKQAPPTKDEIAQNKLAADIATSSSYNASVLITELKGFANVQVQDVMEHMMERRKLVSQGDFEPLEKILMHQAQALDTMFFHYAGKIKQSEYMQQVEVYSQIAFRAQKQCRATITALVNLKSPSNTTFIKQQNNAINQQVNNAPPSPETEKSSENKIFPENELLEIAPHDQLDARETHTTIPAHTEMETVGTIDRGSHPKRKSN